MGAGLDVVRATLAWQEICKLAGKAVYAKTGGSGLEYDRAVAKLESSTSGTFVGEVLGLQSTGRITDLEQAFPEGCDVEERTRELAEKFARWALT